MIKKLIGNKAFYKRLLMLAIPMMIQNGITNFVNMLDNIMVGQVGTLEMTGVAVANQLIFVFNLCIFGAVSGVGIFGAQFYGNDDHKGVRNTFRFKIIISIALSIVCIAVLLLFGRPLLMLYLNSDSDVQNVSASLVFGEQYIYTMLIGLIPYAIVQCYASTLRETGESVLPMYAGIISVIINLCLNYVLIFGNFGAPKLGVLGAAIATVISRFAELIIVVAWTHAHKYKNQFIIGAYKSMSVPRKLIKQIIIKGLPLMINETLWASGIAILNQCYSVRGLNAVAAINIQQTFFNVFSVAFFAVGASIGIILGQMLGAGDNDEARDASPKLIAFSVMVSIIMALLFTVCAEFIPQLYNTNDTVRYYAKWLMQISAFAMPIDAFAHACYFTLRSGGKTLITILFDSCFVWVISLPVAVLLSRLTSMNVLYLFAICQALNLIKCVVGYIFVKKGVWIKNIIV